jgi:hypothetical protein
MQVASGGLAGAFQIRLNALGIYLPWLLVNLCYDVHLDAMMYILEHPSSLHITGLDTMLFW